MNFCAIQQGYWETMFYFLSALYWTENKKQCFTFTPCVQFKPKFKCWQHLAGSWQDSTKTFLNLYDFYVSISDNGFFPMIWNHSRLILQFSRIYLKWKQSWLKIVNYPLESIFSFVLTFQVSIWTCAQEKWQNFKTF